MSATIISQRVLPGLENHLDGAIVIVSNSLFDTASIVRLALIAPSLNELDQLRSTLHDQFKALGADWIDDVRIEPPFETGDPEIVIEIARGSLPSGESVNTVLSLARNFVLPFAHKHWRSVYTLQGEQRLVPLVFERPMTRRVMEVTLPQPLTLRPPRGMTGRQTTRDILGDVDTTDTPAGRCAFLRAALEMAFEGSSYELIGDLLTGEIRNTIDILHHRNEFQVVVKFGPRDPMDPYTINAIQNTIMEVLKRLATWEGRHIHTDFAFVSLTPAGEGDYDDGGDYGTGDYEY